MCVGWHSLRCLLPRMPAAAGFQFGFLLIHLGTARETFYRFWTCYQSNIKAGLYLKSILLKYFHKESSVFSRITIVVTLSSVTLSLFVRMNYISFRCFSWEADWETFETGKINNNILNCNYDPGRSAGTGLQVIG